MTVAGAPPAVSGLLDLAGQAAIVTGAASGIGAAIARRLAEAGAGVVVHYRSDPAAAREVVNAIEAAGGSGIAVGAELAEPGRAEELVDRALGRFGRLDILVNNAGAYPAAPLLDIDLGSWRRVMAANLDTALVCLRAAGAAMARQGGGAIVNVGSIAGSVPAPAQAAYSTAKAALLALTRSAAQELGPKGIRVNAVSPGLVHRPGIEKDWPDGVGRWLARAPLGRLGQPQDVADACLFLASPAARWITGQDIAVDGGMMVAPLY